MTQVKVYEYTVGYKLDGKGAVFHWTFRAADEEDARGQLKQLSKGSSHKRHVTSVTQGRYLGSNPMKLRCSGEVYAAPALPWLAP